MLFKWKYNCVDKGELTKAGPARIESVIRFSKEYKDNVHVDLVDRSEKNPELTIECHRSCVSTYTSQQHLSRHKKREGCASVSASQPLKKQRRSDVPVFRFKENCLFCGELCEIEKDKEHPDRWKKAVLCRTAHAGPGKKGFRESILEACTQRNDDIANQVRVCVEGALSDLHQRMRDIMPIAWQALCLLNLSLLPKMLQRKTRIQTLHLMRSLPRC